jgi:hypothetical protein
MAELNLYAGGVTASFMILLSGPQQRKLSC